jgi:isopenicillin-N N-acyltransferase-like protein
MMTHKVRRTFLVLGGLLVAVGLAHLGVLATTRIIPPAVTIDSAPAKDEGAIRRLGSSYTRVRAGVREVYLEGSAERIGLAHTRLLYDRMVQNEHDLWESFRTLVPFSPARTLLMDVSRVRYRTIDRGFPEARQREIAAEAAAFDPDPYDGRLPTYHRMVFLHALYDISAARRSPSDRR